MLTFNNPTFEETSSKEWLLTNGIGGYASASVNGSNTRRYHGLLVASLNPPTQRQVFVSKIEECISIGRDMAVEFSSNRYKGVIHPNGYQYLKSFARSPLPLTTFQIEGNQIAKTVFMVQGSNTTVVEYENTGRSVYNIKLTPFFVYRDYHSLFHHSVEYDYFCEHRQNVLKIYAHYGATPLYVKYYEGEFKEARYWFKNFEYDKEAYRGLDHHEDTYSLGVITFSLKPGEKAFLMFTLDEAMLEHNASILKKNEIKRLKGLLRSKLNDQFFNDLVIAADQFIVHRASTNSYSIIAGYHWFTDWGRDTMIAMRGLCIALGKQEICKSILKTFFTYLSDGMLPNRFPDFSSEEVEYNTVDATLWSFITLYEYYHRFEDKVFVIENFEKLSSILEWHFKGTRYNIYLTEEGFLFAGEGNVQLTWMDARVGDYVVTPRHGCPVEIQALWYNALKIYQFFAKEFSVTPREGLLDTSMDVCNKIQKNFKTYFLNAEGYLNDVVIPGKSADQALRPNQIYVLSLPFSLLSKEEEKGVFQLVWQKLYSPFGLRSLDPDHPDFQPVYKGNQWERDTAYHQGTIWPFLLGDFFLAQLRLFGNQKKERQAIVKALNTLKNHFYHSDCIHGISEIFDGLNPGAGRGTIQQAWNVGALLMIMAELNLHPTTSSRQEQPSLT